jgi:hypothetical protein
LIISILLYLTQLALGIVGQIKSLGAGSLTAEIIQDVEAGIAALTKVKGSLVTLQQAESLRTAETWPDGLVADPPIPVAPIADTSHAIEAAFDKIAPPTEAAPTPAAPKPAVVAPPNVTDIQDDENSTGNGNPAVVVE